MKLIFIRHGETNTNSKNLTHQTNDITGLTSLGKQQIKKVTKLLKDKKVEKIYSSPEKRAQESANLINQQLSLPIEILESLRERNWGTLEGKPWIEIEKKLKQMSLTERFTFIPPEGESWKQMEKRLKKAIHNIVQTNKSSVCIITHGGTLRGLLPILKNVPKQESFKYDFKNASVTIFDYDKQTDNFKAILINSQTHLH